MEGKLRNIGVAVFMMLCISQNCFALNVGVTNVSWFVFEGAHPGETLSATAVIRSFETETKHFSFTTVGYDDTSDGGFACGMDQNGLLPDPRFNLASWVDFQGADFYIAPNETISVPFNITIPPDAFPGGHAGCFVIQEIILPDPCLGVDMCVLTRQGTRIYLTIDGAAQRITDNSYGSAYNVEFVDIRNTGVLDKFLGPTYYQNIGTKYSPNFTFVTNNYTGIPYFEYFQFADIDGDGAYEILLDNPEAPHQLFLYKNIGTPVSPSWALVNPDVVDIGGGYIRLPALYDIDGNGNLDLFLTTIWGPIFYYRNDGDRLNANWTLVSNDYLSQYTNIASYDIRRLGLAGPTKVAFIDIDNDGIKEMIVGGERGLHAFKQVSSPPMLTWTYMPHALDFLGTDFNCYPTAVDLYGKGADDLFASCQFGQYIYELNYTLSVQIAGTGLGTTTSSDDSKINCGSVCNALYGTGVTVELNANPTSGSTFTGWTGDCTGTSTQLDVLMDKGKSCTATFVLTNTAFAVTNLYGSFTGAGIWKWDGLNWTQTTPNNPAFMVTLGSELYGSFTGAGIWKWDGLNWTQVTPNSPQSMVTLGTDLYGSFAGGGIWKWDGLSWTQVTPNNPAFMVTLGSELYGSFAGGGIWKWDGANWTQVTPNSPALMVATSTVLYGSFTGVGIWKWDGANWTQATPNNPDLMVVSGESLYGSFAGAGIWKLEGTAWSQTSPNNPQQMVASEVNLYGSFTGAGIWKWDGANWTQLTPNEPASMVLGY